MSRRNHPCVRTTGQRPRQSQSDTATENVRAIADLEYSALHSRSFTERVSDAIARAAGSSLSLLGHALLFGGWLLANTKLLPGLPAFDPFPFGLLTTIVSLEAIFLSLFILISQNRMSRQGEHRDHLDLQINLLAEQESTATLILLRRLCERAGIDVSDVGVDTRDLEQDTNVRTLIKKIEHTLPS